MNRKIREHPSYRIFHQKLMFLKNPLFILVFLTFTVSLNCGSYALPAQSFDPEVTTREIVDKPALKEISSVAIRSILEDGFEQIKTVTGYTQKYYSISYPNGDVPKNTGACTDVVIRSFRGAGVDLQKLVHEDMRGNFSAYPKKWGLKRPDTNIDHRRVPNLDKFFKRKGKSLEISLNGSDYKPGDVVAWDLNGKGMTHIGVVSNKWNTKTKRYLIIHNIGSGTRLEDRIFEWDIIGHYRYF